VTRTAGESRSAVAVVADDLAVEQDGDVEFPRQPQRNPECATGRATQELPGVAGETTNTVVKRAIQVDRCGCG
jgi:hypothetical protein